MKKSKVVTLALVSSLYIAACSGKKEDPNQNGYTVHGWTGGEDTVVSARVHRTGYMPFFYHYGSFGMYSNGGYHESIRALNRGSLTRPSFHTYSSPTGKAASSSRGGFGHISSGRVSAS